MKEKYCMLQGGPVRPIEESIFFFLMVDRPTDPLF